MKDSIKNLTELAWQLDCLKTSMRPDYVPKTKYEDRTANGLEKCIVKWVQLMGGQAERIKNSGRYIDDSKVVQDVLGRSRKIGTGKYIPGTGTNGTADISATIKGKSVKIEVKIGLDKQSEAQKEYQAEVERAGGLYFIAKDFDSFVEFYKSII